MHPIKGTVTDPALDALWARRDSEREAQVRRGDAVRQRAKAIREDASCLLGIRDFVTAYQVHAVFGR